MISPRAQLITSVILAQVIRVLAMLVIARFVGPTESGVFALLLAASVVLTGFADFGIPSSLVQVREVDEKTAFDTAMVLGVGIYLVYGIATVGTGIFLVYSGQDSRLIGLSILLAITNLMAAVYNVQLARLNRTMRFGAESKQNIVFAASQAATGIILAASGWGVYALAIQILVGQGIANLAILRHSPLQLPTAFSWTVARRYFMLGGKVSAAVYLANLLNSAVSLAFKGLGGNHLLGCWEKAVRVQSLLSQNLMGALDRVFFTSICAATDDAHRRTLITEATGIYSVVACGFAAWLYVVADDLVAVALGQEWLDAIPLLRVLAIAIPAGGFYGVAYAAAYALGRTGILLFGQLVMLVMIVPLLWFKSDSALWITGIYAGSRYFIALLVLIWVMALLRQPVWRNVVSPSISALQGVACAWGAYLLAGPIDVLAGQMRQLLPDQIYARTTPLEGIFRLTETSVVVFVLYVILTIVLQPAMGRRLLKLTARNRAQPVAAADVEPLNDR